MPPPPHPPSPPPSHHARPLSQAPPATRPHKTPRLHTPHTPKPLKPPKPFHSRPAGGAADHTGLFTEITGPFDHDAANLDYARCLFHQGFFHLRFASGNCSALHTLRRQFATSLDWDHVRCSKFVPDPLDAVFLQPSKLRFRNGTDDVPTLKDVCPPPLRASAHVHAAGTVSATSSRPRPFPPDPTPGTCTHGMRPACMHVMLSHVLLMLTGFPCTQALQSLLHIGTSACLNACSPCMRRAVPSDGCSITCPSLRPPPHTETCTRTHGRVAAGAL